jgi:hypothetical protein
MQRLIMSFASACFLLTSVSTQSSEIVWRSQLTNEVRTYPGRDRGPGPTTTQYQRYANVSPLARPNNPRHAAEPAITSGNNALERVRTNSDHFFRVYRVDQVDSLLATRDQAFSAQVEASATALRQETRDAVVASLRGLPEQLFSAEVRAAMTAELANRLTTAMEERIAIMRRELRDEILIDVEQRLAQRR